MSLDSSRQDFSDSIIGVVVETLVCLQDLFLSFYSLLNLIFLHINLYLKRVTNNIYILEVAIWLSQLWYFSKYFYSIVLFLKKKNCAKKPRNYRNNWCDSNWSDKENFHLDGSSLWPKNRWRTTHIYKSTIDLRWAYCKVRPWNYYCKY